MINSKKESSGTSSFSEFSIELEFSEFSNFLLSLIPSRIFEEIVLTDGWGWSGVFDGTVGCFFCCFFLDNLILVDFVIQGVQTLSVKSNLLILPVQSWSIYDSLGSNWPQDKGNLHTGCKNQIGT